MMYANDKEFVADFVKRTKENYNMAKNGPYEATLLINSAIGLLVIPRDSYYNQIDDSLVSEELLHKINDAIIVNTYSDKGTLKGNVRHMRNGIAHSRWKFSAEKLPDNNLPLRIENITINDHEDAKRRMPAHDFEMTISIETLRDFFFEFSEAMSNLAN